MRPISPFLLEQGTRGNGKSIKRRAFMRKAYLVAVAIVLASVSMAPGEMNTPGQTWKNGGVYLWEICDATGAAGANPGWDLLNINGTLDLSQLTGTDAFTIDVNSLSHSLGDVDGQVDNYVPGTEYAWTIASASGGIIGFDASEFAIDTTHWTGDLGGNAFQMQQSGNDLILALTPEPASLSLLALGVLVLSRRRK
jgi:hypothetical protein